MTTFETPSLVIRGFKIFKDKLNIDEQNKLITDLREIAKDAPLFSPLVAGGNKMSVKMTSAGKYGWFSDGEGYEIMIYAGRANMYDDWLQFQADCKRSRMQEEKDKQYASAKHKQHVIEFFTIICTALVAIPVLGSAVYLILTILGR